MAMEPAGSQGSSFAKYYDVFVSFRGKDVRNTFASHVVHGLENAGVETFYDETGLNVGDRISGILEEAKNSEMFVIIFSENYADSEYCLKEAAIAVECEKSNKTRRKIFPIFYHVQPSDVEDQAGVFGEGFQRLVGEVGIHEPIIEEWKGALKHAAGIKGFVVNEKINERDVITELAMDIQSELRHMNIWRLPKYQVGLDSHVKRIRKQLSLEDNSKVLMVVIYGGIGFGKTTIAKATYNNISRSFERCSFLQDIAQTTSSVGSKKVGFLALQEQLIQDMRKRDNSEPVEDVKRIGRIRKSIRNGKVLIILDDVDNDEQLECLGMTNFLNDLTPGSRVIVTTRIQKSDQWPTALISSEGILNYKVPQLTKEESLKLFCCHVFRSTENPKKDYEENCNKAISLIESSPLAIELTAPYFRGVIENQSLYEHWSLEYDTFLSKDLVYDGLSNEGKLVFMDAACFLVGTELNVAASVLAGWRQPLKAFKEMEMASLLKHNVNNSLEMQRSVRNLGMTLSLREEKDPIKRCRVWDHDDVQRVLRNLTEGSTGQQAANIKCMALESKKDLDETTALNQTVLNNVPNLRILQINQWPVEEKIERLPYDLRFLRWQAYNSGEFSCCFNKLKYITVLDLSYGELEDRWFLKAKALKRLMVLNLSHCKRLTTIPDLSEFTSLEKLMLDGCEKLIEVHPSVGELEKLNVLTMKWCCCLQKLPDNVWESTSLKVLDISDCNQLVIAVKLLESTQSVIQIILSKTRTAEFPTLPVLQISCGSNCNNGSEE